MNFFKNVVLFVSLFVFGIVALDFAGLVDINLPMGPGNSNDGILSGTQVTTGTTLIGDDKISLPNGITVTLCEGTMHPEIDPVTKESKCVSSPSLVTQCMGPDGEAYDQNSKKTFYKIAEKTKTIATPKCLSVEKTCYNGNFVPSDSKDVNDKKEYAFLECAIIDRTDESLQTCKDDNGLEYPAGGTRIQYLQSEVTSDLDCRHILEFCGADGKRVSKFPDHTMSSCDFKGALSSEFIKKNIDKSFGADGQFSQIAQGKIELDSSKLGCTLPWGEKIHHGEQKISFRDKVVKFDEECHSRTHTCVDGKLDFVDPYPFSTCTIQAPRNCSIDETKVTVLHNSSKVLYTKGKIIGGEYTCEEQSRKCYDGALDGSEEYKYTTCKAPGSAVVSGPYKCPSPYVGDRSSLDHGRAGVGYYKSTVGLTESCDGEVDGKINKVSVNCAYGTIQPIGNALKIYKTCAKGTPKSCKTPWGSVINNGETTLAFESSTVGFDSPCQSEVRVCNDGVLAGSFTSQRCSQSQALDCTTPWGTILSHGQSIQTFQSDSVVYGSLCASQTRVCNNGALGGSYAFKSCSQQAPKDCTYEGKTVAHDGVVTKHTAVSANNQGNELEGAANNQCAWYSAKCNNGTMQGNLLSHPEATLVGKCSL